MPSNHDYSRDTDEDVPVVPIVSEDDIRALEQERETLDESFEEQGKRLIKEALPTAIKAIVDLAEKGATETTKLRAAQYIIDRNLGPVSQGTGEMQKAPWEQVLEKVTVAVQPAQATKETD